MDKPQIATALRDIADGNIPGHKAMMWIEDNINDIEAALAPTPAVAKAALEKIVEVGTRTRIRQVGFDDYSEITELSEEANIARGALSALRGEG